jgi:hypothetical protein
MVAAILVIAGGATAAALLAWPDVRIAADDEALAHVEQPSYSGHVTAVSVTTARGRTVPTRLLQGKLWPLEPLPAGDELSVAVTVERPGWAGWLVGHERTSTVRITTPDAQLRGRWLEIADGRPVNVSFDAPVRVVELRGPNGSRVLRFARPRTSVAVGVVARGDNQAGVVTVRSAPRGWERLSSPTRVSWFPAREHVQALVEPAQHTELRPNAAVTVTFSRPTAKVLGSAMPTISPTVSGRWSQVDTHTIAFRPSGLGFPLGGHVAVHLPAAVDIATPSGERATRTLSWEVQHGTILRLHQLLAQTGYLPVDWSSSDATVARTPVAQLAAVADPPAGRFSWPYAATTPKELKGIWRTFEWNEITRGAVMMFEHDHDLEVDAFVGPKVWNALLQDALAGKRRTAGYSYVFVHRNVPQLLTLWHDGKTILTSPGNTGVPAAPTQLGTFPVLEHRPIGTMAGTNPDGSHYNDPGIRWISYFNHGEAIHAFNRSSFGTPQSLGCVELPLAAAAKVWPYTPIGTLVTVEN